jgi:CheY-like chemotaxis protein
MSRTHTILLVEDDPNLRDAIELLLVRKGYHVVSTGDGQRAVQLASQHRVDVALVDLLIPGQSGFQVTTDLKAAYGDAVKVAVMSGNASPAHRDYAYASGAEQFLPKPFTVSQLFEAITKLCPLPTDNPPNNHRRTVRIG